MVMLSVSCSLCCIGLQVTEAPNMADHSTFDQSNAVSPSAKVSRVIHRTFRWLCFGNTRYDKQVKVYEWYCGI
jgi:hypothetical protein